MQFNYPFSIDERGGIATVDEEKHICQMVEQVLFTAIGERVNRPTFGSGINQLVFAPNSPKTTAIITGPRIPPIKACQNGRALIIRRSSSDSVSNIFFT